MSNLSIWMNPLTAWMYQMSISPYKRRMIETEISEGASLKHSGIPVRFDPFLKPFEIEQPRWVFPKESFVTYESSDESWCRYFGIGYQQEARIIEGDIIIRHDLPINEREFVSLEIVEYIKAIRAVERIRDIVLEYLVEEHL